MAPDRRRSACGHLREDGGAVTVHLPGLLRDHTGGQATVEIACPATTAAEALAALWQAYPGLRDRIVNEQGEIRQHVNIFINEDNIRDQGGYSAPVPSGAAITIVPAVSGG